MIGKIHKNDAADQAVVVLALWKHNIHFGREIAGFTLVLGLRHFK